jgi:DNA end-binding protein Ku
VRKEKAYFDEIADEKVPKEMLDLAMHIVDTKRGKFEQQKFEDHYEDALKELLKKKQNGEKIEAPRPARPSNVVNLMDALRASVNADEKRTPARSVHQRASHSRKPAARAKTKRKAG